MPSSWTPLHSQLHRTLKERRLLEAGQRVLVAVSGGQDSFCLLKLLLDLQPKWNWHLAIAHCDHRWKHDAGNADFVRELAQFWNLPFYLETAAEVNQTEAGAREWRYKALSTIAADNGYPYLATGHTASDRAETLLYNLVRGSGADGLQALVWKRSLTPGISLIRPLLKVTRTETAQFCQEMHLRIWEDPTNQDLRYTRNRIRQELLPYLRTHFNPQVEHALAQTAELLQAEVDYLEKAAAEILQQSRHPDDRAGLDRSLVTQTPLALQRRVIRQWLQPELTCLPNFEHVEKVVALLTAPNCSQTDPFPGGAIAYVEGIWIWLKR